MTLYKYFPPERIDVLRKRLVRFIQPSACNDPFEVKPLVSGLHHPIKATRRLNADFEKYIEEMAKEALAEMSPEEQQLLAEDVYLIAKEKSFDPLRQKFIKRAMNQLSKKDIQKFIECFGNKFGFLSLTENPRNILMWAHYAANQTGFVVEFDSRKLFKENYGPRSNLLGRIAKVKYLSNRKASYLTELEELDWFFTKRDNWKYEAEWRVVMLLDDASTRAGRDIHLFQFQPHAIRKIIFGVKTDRPLKTKIHKLIQTDPQLNHVKMGQAILNSVSQKLLIRNL